MGIVAHAAVRTTRCAPSAASLPGNAAQLPPCQQQVQHCRACRHVGSGCPALPRPHLTILRVRSARWSGSARAIFGPACSTWE
jgi:hypothetical protein